MTLSEMINIYDAESAISQSFIDLYYELVTDLVQLPYSLFAQITFTVKQRSTNA